MKKLFVFTLIVLLLTATVGQMQTAYANATKAYNGSATIYVGGSRKDPPIAYGSGFFLNPTTVVTNAHVVTLLKSARDTLGKEIAFYVEPCGSKDKIKVSDSAQVNHSYDLAILTLTRSGRNGLSVASNESLKLGQSIFAVGSPSENLQGLGKHVQCSVMSGTVSGMNRNLPGVEIQVIQVDTPIIGGNSGGPLVNTQNVVVGVIFASFDRIGAGRPYYAFAILAKYIEPVKRLGLTNIPVHEEGVRASSLTTVGIGMMAIQTADYGEADSQARSLLGTGIKVYQDFGRLVQESARYFRGSGNIGRVQTALDMLQ